MKKVAIIGAGELGKQILSFILGSTNDIIVGWFDDTIPKGFFVEGFNVLGSLNDTEHLYSKNEFDEVAIAIGYNHLDFKIKLLKRFEDENIKLYSFIHPSAIVDKSAIIEEGAIIYPGVIVDKNVKICKAVLLNIGAIISHDTEIDECCFIAPGVVCSGFVKIGKCCFVGSGVIIRDNLIITNNVKIGAGGLVVKNINEPGAYIGSSRLFKFLKQ